MGLRRSPVCISIRNAGFLVENTGVLRLEPNTRNVPIKLILSVWDSMVMRTGRLEVGNQLVTSILEGRISLSVRFAGSYW